MVYRHIFIPWIQDELNTFHDQINYNHKHHNQHKIQPQGPPHDIYFHPNLYKSSDFWVNIDPQHLAQVCEAYAPSTDPMFTLVPPAFADAANAFIQELGIDAINLNNVWDTFKNIC
ncbi:hypothetical protein P691DRAFT_676143 [Macrolepiota fuliginosa MF-IS2]|uniref:Uncharacterized protein n=1 Tax=Macrolepiota fuliginosa MF-IS2 TaxID=1400762 RepID=A0A9P5X7P5_9AGAR|nr:hypothetical protein P691DRAFT_676143 [Macrolepiota fuliginosa MF-IS2]